MRISPQIRILTARIVKNWRLCEGLVVCVEFAAGRFVSIGAERVLALPFPGQPFRKERCIGWLATEILRDTETLMSRLLAYSRTHRSSGRFLTNCIRQEAGLRLAEIFANSPSRSGLEPSIIGFSSLIEADAWDSGTKAKKTNFLCSLELGNFGFDRAHYSLCLLQRWDGGPEQRQQIEDWLPSTFRETGELKWFRDNFPTDQFILITWEGCKIARDPEVYPEDVDDPRIAKLADLLRGTTLPADHPDAVEAKKFVKSVSTGREVLDRLISPDNAVSYEDAVERLKGSVLGPDGRQTCLLVSVTEDATKSLKKVLGRGQYRIFRPSVPPGLIRRQLKEVGISEESVHFGGPPVDSISIDEEGERTLVRLAGCLASWGLACHGGRCGASS